MAAERRPAGPVALQGGCVWLTPCSPMQSRSMNDPPVALQDGCMWLTPRSPMQRCSMNNPGWLVASEPGCLRGRKHACGRRDGVRRRIHGYVDSPCVCWHIAQAYGFPRGFGMPGAHIRVRACARACLCISAWLAHSRVPCPSALPPSPRSWSRTAKVQPCVHRSCCLTGRCCWPAWAGLRPAAAVTEGRLCFPHSKQLLQRVQELEGPWVQRRKAVAGLREAPCVLMRGAPAPALAVGAAAAAAAMVAARSPAGS